MSTATLSGLADASKFIESGRFGEAEQLLRDLITQDSVQTRGLESGQLYSMLSVSLEKLDDNRGALEALREAANILEAVGDDQSLPHIFLRMAVIHTKEGDRNDERSSLDRALAAAELSRNGPMLLMVLMALGFVAHRDGEYAAALAYFDRATEVNQFVKDLEAAEVIARERRRVKRLFNLPKNVEPEFQRRKEQLLAAGDVEGAENVSMAMCGLALAAGNLNEAVKHLKTLERERLDRGLQDPVLSATIENSVLALDQNNAAAARGEIDKYLEISGLRHIDSDDELSETDSLSAHIWTLVFGSDDRDNSEVIGELENLRSGAVAAEEENSQVLALVELGRRYHDAGELERARAALQEAVEIGTRRANYTMHTLAGRRLVPVLLDLKDYDAARAVLQNLIELSQTESDARDEVLALLELGSADFLEGTGDGGRGYLRAALELARDASDELGQAEALFRLATIDSDEDHTQAAIKKLKAAIVIARRHGFNEILYNSLRNLTNCYWKTRNYHTHKLSQEAQAIALEAGRISDYAEALRDESSASQALKQYDRALEDAIGVLRAHQGFAPSPAEAGAIFQIGSILRDMDRRREALEFMTVGAWLDEKVSSEHTFTHQEHVSLMAVQWNMERDLFELAASAGDRYGVNRGEEMVNEVEASLKN